MPGVSQQGWSILALFVATAARQFWSVSRWIKQWKKRERQIIFCYVAVAKIWRTLTEGEICQNSFARSWALSHDRCQHQAATLRFACISIKQWRHQRCWALFVLRIKKCTDVVGKLKNIAMSATRSAIGVQHPALKAKSWVALLLGVAFCSLAVGLMRKAQHFAVKLSQCVEKSEVKIIWELQLQAWQRWQRWLGVPNLYWTSRRVVPPSRLPWGLRRQDLGVWHKAKYDPVQVRHHIGHKYTCTHDWKSERVWNMNLLFASLCLERQRVQSGYLAHPGTVFWMSMKDEQIWG